MINFNLFCYDNAIIIIMFQLLEAARLDFFFQLTRYLAKGFVYRLVFLCKTTLKSERLLLPLISLCCDRMLNEGDHQSKSISFVLKIERTLSSPDM